MEKAYFKLKTLVFLDKNLWPKLKHKVQGALLEENAHLASNSNTRPEVNLRRQPPVCHGAPRSNKKSGEKDSFLSSLNSKCSRIFGIAKNRYV